MSVTSSATWSTSMTITPITNSNIISKSIINRQSLISKIIRRYLHLPGSHQSTWFLEWLTHSLTQWLTLSLLERLVTLKTKMSKGLRWGGIWQRWGKYFCKEHFLHTAVCHRNTLTMTNAEAPLNRGSKWGFEAGSRSWPLVSRSNTRLLDLCTLLFLAVLYRDAKSSERRERVCAINWNNWNVSFWYSVFPLNDVRTKDRWRLFTL